MTLPPPNRLADISVVIPTLGRPVLARALAALAAGTRHPAEVLVVDQGRSPEVEEITVEARTEGLVVRYLPSAERGRALGVNRGIEASTTRFIAVTDDDCLVHAEWLERLSGCLHESPDTIVTGRVEAGDDTVLSAMTDERPILQRRPALRFDRLSGGNMGLARSIVDRIGGFDEDPCLRTAEDGEYAYRALRAGIPIRYAPSVVVTHLGWRDDQEREQQYADYGRSQGGFYGKYLRRGDAFMLIRTGIHLARASRRWLVGTLRGDTERARNGRAYVLELLPGLAAGIRSRAPGWRSP